ncbi:porin [Thalassotalea sp. PLHSN55]|uniref:porin n=1 Tax=Thalassotalea sp. PLHSN55 TaxID=3435888 RepID=UPI003F845C79
MNNKLTTIALATAFITAPVHAEIMFSGFGQIVAGTTTSSSDTLYGYDDNIDFKEGSLFALQASTDLENGLGVTVQLTAKGADDWDPDFKWAYLSYDVNDELRVLAGRQRVPFYMYSDYLDVSYAYPWITPPSGVYDLIIDTFDGLGAIYTTNFGDVDATFHGMVGRNTDTLELLGDDVKLETNDFVGLASTFTYDWLTLRAAYFVADLSMPIQGLEALSAGWTAAGQADVAANTSVNEDSTSFLELGFQVNIDQVIVVGEYTELDIDNSPFGVTESFYVMAGYQFDTVLVHVTYGADDDVSDIFTSHIPYGINDSVDFLKAQTEGFVMSQNEDQDYITLGLRYDFHDSAALKFEYTDFSDNNASINDAGLLRAAIVTVF